MYTDVLKDKAPAVFRTADEGAEIGASKYYQFMTTSEVIEGLETLGWKLYDAMQQKSKRNPDTTKHMLRFRHDDFGSVGINGNIPEILLVNSHDRTASLNFHVGVFKVVCGNGLIVASETFSQKRVRHMGTTFEDVKEIINKITTNLPLIFGMINRFQGVNLTDDEKMELAYKSLSVRYPEFIDEKTNNIDTKRINDSIDVVDLLKPLRADDEGNCLWNVFNLLQEKLIKGGFLRQGLGEKPRAVRPISNIRMNIIINKGLWGLAETYAK